MKIMSVFNNKGGVGKRTLSYHMSYALNEIGYKVLMIDLDPQCNLTIHAIDIEQLHDIWKKEDEFIEAGFDATKKEMIDTPIGLKNVMHSHNTLLGMAQKYKNPIWNIPNLDELDTF